MAFLYPPCRAVPRLQCLRILIGLWVLHAAAALSFAEPRVILRGDYADPSILRDGEDFYMTHSAFMYKPGFLILHSRNLIDWEPVVRSVPEFEGSAYAPDLVKVKGKFHLYFPSAGVNWVVTADDIHGPWSKPVRLTVGKIDPGHAVGEDGKRYLFLNAGQRIGLSDDGLSVLGSLSKVYDGWDFPKDWNTEGKWLESPKIVHRGDYFYLVSAEGGTAGPATSHMAIVARSRSIHGPWENSPHNPLIHTYSAQEPWWSKGHATLFDDANGNWWVVYHGYKNGDYSLGRNTLLEPVEWTPDAWPVLSKTWHPLPGKAPAVERSRLACSDDFRGSQLGIQWTAWRDFTGVRVEDGKLQLEAKGDSPAEGRILLQVAEDSSYEIEAELSVPTGAQGGLTLFYNEKAFVALGCDGTQLLTSVNNVIVSHAQPPARDERVFLKIAKRAGVCDLQVRRSQSTWQTVLGQVDVGGLHHNNFKGFLALRPGVFASGKGQVIIHSFVYRPLP